MAQKFIITNTDWLRFGNVELHRELLQPGEDCLGGGFYEFDYASGRMLLYGKSYDFGRPKWSLVGTLRLPASISQLQILYEGVPLGELADLEPEEL